MNEVVENLQRPIEVRNAFFASVSAERQKQIEKGYTAERDDKSGVDHLLMWAIEYLYRGEPIKAGALVEAGREALGRKLRSLAQPSRLVESQEELDALPVGTLIKAAFHDEDESTTVLRIDANGASAGNASLRGGKFWSEIWGWSDSITLLYRPEVA